MDCSPPGSSVHGIFQARIREWVAISSFRRSSQPWDQIHISSVSCIGRQTLYHWATWEAVSAVNKLLVYCLCPSASMCVHACVCVCVCVVFFHGVLCFLPKFFWISWIRTWTFGKAFPVSILSIYERSEYGRTFGRSKHEPLSTSTRVWVEVGFLFCYSLVSSPDCLGGVWRQRQLNINAVQLAQCKNRFRGSGFCYCIIEASTFNLHLWYHYSFTFW